MKAGKGRSNCTRTVAVVLSALTLLGGVACGKETENVSTAQLTAEAAESGQTETPTTGHEGATSDSSSGCRLPADIDRFPPEKQSLERQWFAECEAAAAGYHAPKFPEPSPVLSCPTDLTKIATGIFPYDSRYQPPLFWRKGLPVNLASAISTAGVPYTIAAGAEYSDSQQGVIYVMQESTDPCAEAAGTLRRFEGRFDLPVKTGPVTLTAIESDFISFETVGGTKGKFGYTTGEFILQ